MNTKVWSAAMIVPLAAAAAVATAPSAGAVVEPRNAATARAACSDRSQVVLTGRANPNNRIVLTLKVTTNRPRPAWDVRIVRDNPNFRANVPIFVSRELTFRERFAQRRSFEVVTRTPNRLGPDRFVARAVHVASGEVCRVAITVRGNNALHD